MTLKKWASLQPMTHITYKYFKQFQGEKTMTTIDEINKAIGAHGLWKMRLRSAIDTGKSDFSVANVRPDNLCEFGKWLYALPAADKNSEQFKKVKDLHAQFHEEAAAVIALAVGGKKHEAEMAIAPGGTFTKISSKLTAAMIAWGKTL